MMGAGGGEWVEKALFDAKEEREGTSEDVTSSSNRDGEQGGEQQFSHNSSLHRKILKSFCCA